MMIFGKNQQIEYVQQQQQSTDAKKRSSIIESFRYLLIGSNQYHEGKVKTLNRPPKKLNFRSFFTCTLRVSLGQSELEQFDPQNQIQMTQNVKFVSSWAINQAKKNMLIQSSCTQQTILSIFSTKQIKEALGQSPTSKSCNWTG